METSAMVIQFIHLKTACMSRRVREKQNGVAALADVRTFGQTQTAEQHPAFCGLVWFVGAVELTHTDMHSFLLIIVGA